MWSHLVNLVNINNKPNMEEGSFGCVERYIVLVNKPLETVSEKQTAVSEFHCVNIIQLERIYLPSTAKAKLVANTLLAKPKLQ